MFGRKKEDEWLKGFEAGFNKAWDWMKPYMQLANNNLKKSLYDEAMGQAIKDLEPTIKKRLEALKEE
jgi:hypothetical protein